MIKNVSATSTTRPSVEQGAAFIVIFAAPLLAFQALPTPGILTLSLLMPAGIIVISILREPLEGLCLPRLPTIFLALLALSVVWSDLPDYSAERLRTYVPLIAATLLAVAVSDRSRVLRALTWALGLVVVSGVLLSVGFESARTHSNGDFSVHGQFSKNVFGGLLFFALCAVLAQPSRWRAPIVAFLLVVIALNRSVTVWAVTLGILVLWFAIRSLAKRTDGHKEISIVAAPMTLALLAVPAVMTVFRSSLPLDNVGKDATLGQRSLIWSASWDQVQQAPLLGHGAFAFLDNSSNSPVTRAIQDLFSGYQPPHPHNGFLDLAGQLGIVGVVVFAAFVITALWQGLRGAIAGSRNSLGGLSIVLGTVLFGATEPTYLGPWLVTSLIGWRLCQGREATQEAMAAAEKDEPSTRPLRASL